MNALNFPALFSATIIQQMHRVQISAANISAEAFRSPHQKPKESTETAFSIDIFVDGCVIGANYSGISISRSISGLGTGGLSITSLSFSVPKEDYAVLRPAKKAPLTAVTITRSDGAVVAVPSFYADSRICSQGKIQFTCYDRMAFADSIYFTESDLTDVPEFAAAISAKTDKTDIPYISALALVTVIARKMEIIFSGGLDVGAIKDIDAEGLPGTSCADWLEQFAAVLCGFFYISNDNKLKFARFNEVCGYVEMTPDYTTPDIGDTLVVSELVISGDSGKRYEYTYDEDPGGLTLNINGGSLADSTTSASLARSVLGTTYTYWSISKAVIGNIPPVNSYCSLYDDSGDDVSVYCIANNISLSISRSGILASLSANSAGGGEIGQFCGKISRQLENAVKFNQRFAKNHVITRYQEYWEDNDEE